jgi:glutamine amidotransferase
MPEPCKVVIVDYGTGNLSSVRRSLAKIGTDSKISGKIADIESSDKLILSGVGHFESAMKKLKKSGLGDAIEKAVLVDKKPVLGICLGMQMMAKMSEEGNSKGLGWLDASAVRFKPSAKPDFKTLHVGWNRVTKKKDSLLMKNIPDNAEFYFIHSFYLDLGDRADILNETEYAVNFPAAIEKDNIFGVQYHPEKSHDAGLQLLKNFVEL